MLLAILFLGSLVLLFTGMPIFAALALSAVATKWFAAGNLGGLVEAFTGEINSYLLVAIPLFAFMANIMIRTRVVDDLFAFAHALTRNLPGGLAVATTICCTIFAAISGSSVATALTIGAVAIPQMVRYGYSLERATGAVAGGGTLGILIPPSGPMILFALVSDASIGGLFVAGIVPGLLLAGIFAVFQMITSRRRRDEQTLPRATLGELGHSLRNSIGALTLPAIVLGGIYSGYFTPTEAAAIGCFGAMLVAAIFYRTLTIPVVYQSARDALLIAAMLLLIVGASGMFSHVLTLTRLPNAVLEYVVALNLSQLSFLLMLMAVIFLLGTFLEAVAIILIVTPIVLPSLIALDVNLIWFGILLVINLELALLSPPVGMNLFVLKGISNATLGQITRGSVPYMLILVGFLLLCLFVPQIVTWLPTQAGYR